MQTRSEVIHQRFSLSYAAFIVLPRLSLQELPDDLQRRFVDLMDEIEATGLFPDGAEYTVMRKSENGKFIKNRHWCNYRRGTVAEAKRIDEENTNANK